MHLMSYFSVKLDAMKSTKTLVLFVFAIALLTISASYTCEQFLPTKLRIFVRNDLGNLVEGAAVTLYSSEEDYNKSENPVAETQITDSKGRVTFKDVEPKVYFVHVEKGDLNNYGGGIKTDKLEEGKLNKTTIVIN